MPCHSIPHGIFRLKISWHAIWHSMPCHTASSLCHDMTWHSMQWVNLVFSCLFWCSRGQFHHWCFQVKIKAAANVSYVTDEMMHACGGVAYKKELGRSTYKHVKEKGRKNSTVMTDARLPSLKANVFRVWISDRSVYEAQWLASFHRNQHF